MENYIKISLTKGYTAIIDKEDEFLVSSFKWHVAIKKNKYLPPKMYAEHAVSGRLKNGKMGAIKHIFLHHLVLGVTPTKGTVINFMNTNGLDCRKENLRLCNPSQRRSNARSISNTGFLGVCKIEQFRAYLKIGKKIYLNKVYHTALEAAKAYDDIAKQILGEFARLNFPEISAPK
jgi:hypothetical protein